MSSLQPLRSPLGVLCESSADICHVIVDFLGTTRSAIQLACASRAWYEHVCSADVWEAYAQLHMPHLYARQLAQLPAGDDAQWMDVVARWRVSRSVGSSPRDCGTSASRSLLEKVLWATFQAAQGILKSKRPKIWICGQEGSGRGTISYKLQCPVVLASVSFNIEQWEDRFAFSLLGCPLEQIAWCPVKDADGVVFVVDSSAARDESESVSRALQCIHEELRKGVPLLVLANKQDLPNAAPTQELAAAIHAAELFDGRPWLVQPCCALTEEGLSDGLVWLEQNVRRLLDLHSTACSSLL